MRDDRSCERYEELIPDLVDGTLSGALAGEVRDHIGRCPGCRRSYEALAGLERELGALPSLVPDGAAVAATVTGRLGLVRHSRATALLRRIPLDRLALPLGITAVVLATWRFIGGIFEGMTAALTGWLSEIAGAVGALSSSSVESFDPLILATASALMLIACAVLSLTALRIVRR